ncbi:MAG: hypothetical protein KC439_09610 [Yoonia sp.]|nr:hypothetical protein [Yoonia sp.]
MMGFDRLKRKWLRFMHEETATVSVEFVMMAPLMAWAFVTTLQFFDAYRAELISTKAAVTIADMYSREDGLINAEYLNGTRDLLKFLTLAEASPDYRVTVFFWRETQKDYRIAWGKNRGSRLNMSNTQLNEKAGRLPKLSDGERAILIETWTDYTPKYGNRVALFLPGTSLEPLEFSTFIVTSPRFAPSLCWNNTPDDPSGLRC